MTRKENHYRVEICEGALRTRHVVCCFAANPKAAEDHALALATKQGWQRPSVLCDPVLSMDCVL